jgi:hypothetical protein
MPKEEMQIGLVALYGRADVGAISREYKDGSTDRIIPTSFTPRFLTTDSILAPATFVRSPRLKTLLTPWRSIRKRRKSSSKLREVCEEFDQETAAAKAEFDRTFGGLDGLGDCE